MMQTLLILVLPACLAVSFLCAGMEAGVFTLSRWRIAQQMRAGKKRAARLYGFLENTENFLWTILVGNTLGAFLALWIVAIALLEPFSGQPWLFWCVFIGAVFVFYTFCDLLPKTLFRTYPNRLCLAGSTPFRFLHVTLSPLVAAIEGLTNVLLRWSGGRVFKGQMFSNRNELRLLMEDPAQALTTEERSMIGRVFDMNNITVRQIAVPFGRFPLLHATDSIDAAMRAFRETPANLVPVWNADAKRKRVAGFLSVKELIFDGRALPGDLVQKHQLPVYYLDEDVRLQEALRRMQRTGNRMAVIMARDRREIGVITLEEILKVIFGEVKL